MDTPTQTDQQKLNWLEEEAQAVGKQTEYNDLPSLKLVEGKVAKIVIDFSKPFEKWTGEQGNKTITKAIIPVTENGEAKNFWLNVRNPLYVEIIHRGRNGQKEFKILQTGKQASTKYVIVED